ncbi:MAG: nicotinate (nicotinamide) nucleotide adenylyltransferase [Sphaerochaetaceae bacterium]|jgi:nicotinate-nucleotide adenylyltransferase|nr:nicotinate (nicotinamide) nucleotide adenylyltransferase [Spirochaetaceae bacterium]MDY6344580.1 nicotinate (nicotinamide) nucleotide adenylyltransferase [Sphaerochaetaceae bacterium]
MEHAAVMRLATAMVGGSFDPVHLGHLHLIHSVLTSTGYRRFILVPVAKNNFKQEVQLASGLDRFEMLRLAVKAYPSLYPDDPKCSLIVDPMELERGGVSYTSDTVAEIYQKYPVDGKLGVVMGDDLLPGLPKWHDFDELRKVATFVVARRESAEPVWNGPDIDLKYIHDSLFSDSSTEIRDAIGALRRHSAMPEVIRALMPKEVADYVETHRLYRH